MAEFSLLQYMGVDDITRPKSKEELEEEQRKKKIDFNDFQLRAHRAQELKYKQRLETNHTGRACRTTHQERDHRHHHGNYWFSQGKVADSHVEVGKAKPPPKEIKRSFRFGDDDGESSVLEEGSPYRHERALQQQLPHEDEKPLLILRPREAPPRPSGTSSSSAHHPQQGGGHSPRSIHHHQSRPVSSPYQGAQQQHSSYNNNSFGGGGVSSASAASMGSPYRRPGSPAASSRMDGGLNRSHTPPVRTTPTHSSHQSTGTPYAEHYESNGLYDVPLQPGEESFVGLGGGSHGNSRNFHMDQQGIPRGRQGVDYEEGQAREAQRLAEEMRNNAARSVKKMQQAEMKQQLDELVQIKRRRKQEEREIDGRTVYGYTLPIPQTERERKVMQRQDRSRLEAEWATQAREVQARKAAEKEYYKPQQEDWNAVNHMIDASESAAMQGQPNGSQQPWLNAWQEHQQTEGALRKAAVEDQIQREMATIGPNVLNYSNRILLAEQQRKVSQQEYKDQLDSQVRQRQYDKRARLAENAQRDARFHRPPFTARQ